FEGGIAPEMQWGQNVPIGDKAVVGMLFDSSRAPYVVKARVAAETEVPWREGTRTRSARRQDLIRLLAPTIRLPRVEPIRGELHVDPSQLLQLKMELHVCFELFDPSPVTISFHRSDAMWRYSKGYDFTTVMSFVPPGGRDDIPIRFNGEQMVASGADEVYSL